MKGFPLRNTGVAECRWSCMPIPKPHKFPAPWHEIPMIRYKGEQKCQVPRQNLYLPQTTIELTCWGMQFIEKNNLPRYVTCAQDYYEYILENLETSPTVEEGVHNYIKKKKKILQYKVCCWVTSAFSYPTQDTSTLPDHHQQAHSAPALITDYEYCIANCNNTLPRSGRHRSNFYPVTSLHRLCTHTIILGLHTHVTLFPLAQRVSIVI